MISKKLAGLAAIAGLFFVGTASAQSTSIVGTAHDLSNEQNIPTGGQICIVCHTPHNADTTVAEAPLWNHETTGATFTLYDSPTFDGATTIGQPGGASKLCLSCHDGTVAIDSFGGRNGNIFMTGGEVLGTDLSGDHPISFTYDSALATTDPGLYDPATQNSGLGGTIDADMLFAGSMQCASCHDVHDNSNSPFLRLSNAGSAMCLTCHNK
jgi:predicted CXXCH cytochrome family protein